MRTKRMLLVAVLSACLLWMWACGGDDDDGIAGACGDICDKMVALCSDIDDADECLSECSDTLDGVSEGIRDQVKNCILNAGDCATAMACQNLITTDGDQDDITIEVVVTTNYSGETSATGYLAFFGSKEDAQAAADTGGGCAVAVYTIPLSGNGALRGTKDITLPKATYYVIGFADLNGDACINQGERVHSFIRTYKFEEWMINDVEDARKVQLQGNYDGTDTVCPDFDACGTLDGDVDNVDNTDTTEDSDIVDGTDDVDTDETATDTGQATATVDGTVMDFTGENIGGSCWIENTPQAGWFSCSWINGDDQLVIGVPYDIAAGASYTEADYPLSFKLWIDLGGVRYAPESSNSMTFDLGTWSDTTGAGSFSGVLVEQYGDATVSVTAGTFTGVK